MNKPILKVRLSEILKERQMTQKKLAEQTGLSENAISKLAGGSPRQIRLDTLARVTELLDVGIEELFAKVD